MTSDESLALAKRRERDRYQKLLRNLSFPELMIRSSDLSARFFAWMAADGAVLRGRDVVSFHPFDHEPQLTIEREARDEPYGAAYVRIESWEGREMTARRARRDTPDLWEEFDLGRGRSVFQPKATQPECEKSDIGLILVPGTAFTPSGARLGRGAGFYDRFLRLHPAALRVGIAFEVQIAPVLPEEPWDERVDIVLTDRTLYSSKRYEEWRIHGKIGSRTAP